MTNATGGRNMKNFIILSVAGTAVGIALGILGIVSDPILFWVCVIGFYVAVGIGYLIRKYLNIKDIDISDE